MNDVLQGSLQLLKPGGWFTALEPAYLVRYDRISRWILSKNRGANILFDFEWRNSISKIFSRVEIKVANRLIRIPYTYALINAWKV
jgi:hypothetical protein